MVLNHTFNNISVISWWSVLLVENTGVPGNIPVRITNSDTLRIVENTTLELACAAQDGNPTVASFSWCKDNSTASIAMISNLSFSKI
jgi:hypothetical protein